MLFKPADIIQAIQVSCIALNMIVRYLHIGHCLLFSPSIGFIDLQKCCFYWYTMVPGQNVRHFDWKISIEF